MENLKTLDFKVESSVPTEMQQRTQEIMQEICDAAGRPDAFQWLGSCFNLAMTWDHIVDDDEIDKTMADQMFRIVTTEWGLNAFYRDNSALLCASWANVISSWDSTNRKESPKIKALDIFSELTSTVCFILHGMAGVNKWMPEFRRLTTLICEEDDRKDGGKL